MPVISVRPINKLGKGYNVLKERDQISFLCMQRTLTVPSKAAGYINLLRDICSMENFLIDKLTYISILLCIVTAHKTELRLSCQQLEINFSSYLVPAKLYQSYPAVSPYVYTLSLSYYNSNHFSGSNEIVLYKFTGV